MFHAVGRKLSDRLLLCQQDNSPSVSAVLVWQTQVIRWHVVKLSKVLRTLASLCLGCSDRRFVWADWWGSVVSHAEYLSVVWKLKTKQKFAPACVGVGPVGWTFSPWASLVPNYGHSLVLTKLAQWSLDVFGTVHIKGFLLLLLFSARP